MIMELFTLTCKSEFVHSIDIYRVKDTTLKIHYMIVFLKVCYSNISVANLKFLLIDERNQFLSFVFLKAYYLNIFLVNV